MATRIRVRRGTSTQWISINPLLLSGEFGYETDTGKVKIGDGSTLWNDLNYFQLTFIDGDIFQGNGDTVENRFTIKDYGIEEIKLSESAQQKLNINVYTEVESNTVFFNKNYIIGNTLAISGNIAFDFTNAKLGSKTIMRHDESSFTLPNEAILLSPTQSTTETNYIEFTAIDITPGLEKVHVIIRQENI